VTAKRRPRTGGKGPPFDIDRIVVLRIAIAVVAVVFLYLILKVSMIAFGGSSARETRRIERAVDPATAARPADIAAPTGSGPPPDR
jgi:hypothetical protein